MGLLDPGMPEKPVTPEARKTPSLGDREVLTRFQRVTPSLEASECHLSRRYDSWERKSGPLIRADLFV